MKIRANVTCNIAELAARDNVKQIELCRMIGASSKSQVGRWFNHQEIPHALYLLRIHKAFGWTLEEMISEEE